MDHNLTHTDNIHDFQVKLDNIEGTVRDIGRDFNSEVIERGMLNVEMAARLGIMVFNTGSAATFRRPGCKETPPDITLVLKRIVSTIRRWEFLEDYTGSGHQYITFEIDHQSQVTQTIAHGTTRK